MTKGIAVPVSNIEIYNHIESVVFRNMESNERIWQECYTGSLSIDANRLHALSHFDYKSLLPIYGHPSLADMFVKAYDGDLIKSAALVAPLAHNFVEDEEGICSVDSFSLGLEPQVAPGVNGVQNCLVLRFKVGILGGHVWRIGYHVSILVARGDHREIQIPGAKGPR
jgi:hypothetical protein